MSERRPLFGADRYNHGRVNTHFQPMANQIKQRIAVRALVEHVLRQGDLVQEFGGSGRAIQAIHAHRSIQKSRPPGYLAEVTVSHEVGGERILLIIGGRIDGVFETASGVVIDEIKTTTRDLEMIRKSENPLHWGQAKAYAYMYAVAHDLEDISVQLTYAHLHTRDKIEMRRPFQREELKTFFHNLVSRYLKWAESVAAGLTVRDESIHRLEFPFQGYRPGQRSMAVAVYRAVRDQKQLIIQAATGIGKTMGTLFPALKALGEERISKIFFLTARTTGKRAAELAINELQAAGLHIKALTITAKDRICFCPDATCTPDECAYAKGYHDRVSRARETAFQENNFNRETIQRLAREYTLCPFEFSLEMALWSDCIICDYNYAFDPRVHLRRFFGDEKKDYVFLIDESHNLVDRSREMFSAAISKKAFLDLRPVIKADLPQVYTRLGKINAWLLKAGKQRLERDTEVTCKQAPTDLYPLLNAFLKTTERCLADSSKKPFNKDLLSLFFTVSHFMRTAETYDETYATCYTLSDMGSGKKDDRDVRVRLFCMDPSLQLNAALKRCLSAIFFSATLRPMAYYRKVLGCHASADRLVVPSPFPRQNLCVLIANHISTLYSQRDRTMGVVCRAVLDLVKHRSGNYLIFFPSYAYMMKIYERAAQEDDHIRLLVQKPGMSETDRDRFLDRFSRHRSQTLVGFVVLGGVFAEGIDLVGDRLTGVVIVGVGLPGISVERDLIRSYFDGVNHTGFEYAYRYPGITRVFQAAGRVIRSEQDRGVVLLIDERFSRAGYRSLFPGEWRPVRVSRTRDLAPTLDRFWNENG